MNLYLISQNVNNYYDTYDSAVVAAESEEKARWISPSYYESESWDGKAGAFSAWCNVEDVQVEFIGVAKKGTQSGIILSSFNAD